MLGHIPEITKRNIATNCPGGITEFSQWKVIAQKYKAINNITHAILHQNIDFKQHANDSNTKNFQRPFDAIKLQMELANYSND